MLGRWGGGERCPEVSVGPLGYPVTQGAEEWGQALGQLCSERHKAFARMKVKEEACFASGYVCGGRSQGVRFLVLVYRHVSVFSIYFLHEECKKGISKVNI